MQKKISEIRATTQPQTPSKLTKLVAVLESLMSDEFTGHIKINFSQGGIGRIEKFEEILKFK